MMAMRSLADTPPLVVSREKASCSRCKGAKTKCDGQTPACSACRRLGRGEDCWGTSDDFARGRERSFVVSLESEIRRLQKELAVRRGHHTVAEPGPAQQREASDVESLVSDFGFLAVNATSRDIRGFEPGIPFASLVLIPSTLEEIPSYLARPLPDQQMTRVKIQQYLQSIFVLLPFFDETSLWASVNALQQGQGRDWDHWVVYMVLANTSASLSRKKGDAQYLEALGFAATALTKAGSVFHPGSIRGIQAILYLVQFALFQPDHFDSWHLIGIASRVMVDLGLHQECRQSLSPQIELRKRVFYCVYTLDRTISMALRRAFSFSDNSVEVSMPSPTPPAQRMALGWNQKPQALGAAHHLLDIRRLQSEWYQELFQSGREPYPDGKDGAWAYSEAMCGWFETTADSFPPGMKTFFELELLYSYVYVRSPSRRIATETDRARILTFEHCISFADLMSLALTDRDAWAMYPPHDALRVYLIGTRFHNTIDYFQGLPSGGPLVNPLDLSSTLRANPTMSSANEPDNVVRSIRCLNKITEILGIFGSRWGRSAILQQIFQEQSRLVLGSLHQRRMEHNARPEVKSFRSV